MDEQLLEQLMECWPPDWPGKSVIDLDDFGDCGYYLQQFIENDGDQSLLDASSTFDEDVAILTDMYLQALEDQGRTFPFDCFESDEQAVKAIQEDFKAFLTCWRQRYISSQLGNMKPK